MNARRKGNGKGHDEQGPAQRRCAIYTRKSTDKGLEQSFNSLDAQRESCEHYIATQADKGWLALETHYDDGGFSGANTDRPAFQRLLDDVDARRVDAIIVYKVDRVSRSLLDFAQFMDRLSRAGVAFVSVTQSFSTADAMGRLTLNMLMSFAEFEREMIAERTRDKMTASRRKGKWTGGTVPLGYDVKDKKLVVNAHEAELVRRIFDRYLALQSTLKVMHELNTDGYRTKARKRRDRTAKHTGLWTKAAVIRVLRNPIFAGYIALGDERFEGEHKAILDRETFEQVGRILNGHTPQQSATHSRNPAYLLRGLIYCGACHAHCLPASTRRGDSEYRYYRCEKRDKEGAAACPGRPLPAAAIENFVVGKLRDEIRSRDLGADVLVALRARIDQRRVLLEGRRKLIPREIAGLSAEGRKLVNGLKGTEGAADRGLEARLQEVGTRLEDAERRLAEVGRQLAALDSAGATQTWVTAVLQDFDALWDVMTDENRGRLVRVLVERVEVDGASGDVTIMLADPAASILDGVEAEEEGKACEQHAAAARCPRWRSTRRSSRR